MPKTFVKDIHEKDHVESVFQVGRKALPMGKNGKPYMTLTLQDKSGTIDARIWEDAAELDKLFDKGDLVKVDAATLTHQGHLQLKIDKIEKAELGEMPADDFAAPPQAAEPAPLEPSHASGEKYSQLIQQLDRVQDPHIRALLRSFADDPEIGPLLRRAPAAKTIHHAYPGGLLDHTLSCIRLAHRLADHYPMVERDLLIAGAFLHDIGKVRELSFERSIDYSDEGRLVGHLVITAQLIREKARAISGFPAALEHHITHIVISHHGALEYGSPKVPQTLEALLVHQLDEMDSRVASWLSVMSRDPGDRWTEYNKLYDRHIWKGQLPTASAKRPVEARSGKRRHKVASATPGEHAPSEGGPSTKVERAERSERSERREGSEHRSGPRTPDERRERRDREPRAPRGDKKPAAEVKLTFKPFAAIAIAEGENKPAAGGDDSGAAERAEAPPQEHPQGTESHSQTSGASAEPSEPQP